MGILSMGMIGAKKTKKHFLCKTLKCSRNKLALLGWTPDGSMCYVL